MPVSHEILQQTASFATFDITSINPAVLVAAAAAAGGAANFKKLTPYLHHTVNEGEVGVAMRRGKPIERRHFDLAYGVVPYRARGITEEQAEEGESKYKILQPGWYPVLPLYKIEPVYVSDIQSDISFDVETDDGKKMDVHGQVTWGVIPTGDSPVHSITRVKHVKETKKELSDKEKTDDKEDQLKQQVLSICTAGLGRHLTDRHSEELKTMNKREAEVHEAMVAECAERLLYYGVEIRDFSLWPIVRNNFQVVGKEDPGSKDGISPEGGIDPRVAAAIAEEGSNVRPLFPGGSGNSTA